jgi:hypothetical protein
MRRLLLRRLYVEGKLFRRSRRKEDEMKNTRYAVVVGEAGNEMGHRMILRRDATECGARVRLRRELKKYGNDGWGYAEVNCDGLVSHTWQRLEA